VLRVQKKQTEAIIIDEKSTNENLTIEAENNIEIYEPSIYDADNNDFDILLGQRYDRSAITRTKPFPSGSCACWCISRNYQY
jgi:hypothetical protein